MDADWSGFGRIGKLHAEGKMDEGQAAAAAENDRGAEARGKRRRTPGRAGQFFRVPPVAASL